MVRSSQSAPDGGMQGDTGTASTARILGALAMGVAAMSASTQYLAHVFAYQDALGANAWGLYPPWRGLVWSLRWADQYPWPFFVAQIIFVCGVLAALGLAFAIKPGAKPFGLSAWADFTDVSAAGLFAKRGIVLGRFKGEMLCYDGPEHHLVVGASRSGKGRGHIVPTLLAWPHSALVLDVKSELAFGDGRHGFPGTAGFRAMLGDILVFAPTRMDSSAFNPLFEVRRGANEVRDVQNLIEIIVDPAGDSRHQDFWDRSAKQVLVGVILHVLYTEPQERKTLAIVRERLSNLDATAEIMRATLHRRCPQTGKAETHPEVLHAAQSYLAGEERLRSGIKATAESFFGVFADPIVAANTARSDFRLGDLVCGERPLTLYLQPPPSDAARLMPLMRLVLNQAARALTEDQGKDAAGRVKQHPLLLLLDEFPQLGRMPFFETAMGAMAGYGVKVYLVCQSLNHIQRAYGRENVILDNCHVVTAFAAADMETAKRIADMAGDVWEMRPQLSEHRPRALFGARKGSVTYREERRPLLSPGDVRALPREQQLVFVAGAKPLRAEKLRFDTEPLFVKRLRPIPQTAAKRAKIVHDWIDVTALGVREVEPMLKRPRPALSRSVERIPGVKWPRQDPPPRSRGI